MNNQNLENNGQYQWIMDHPEEALDADVSHLPNIGPVYSGNLITNVGMTLIRHLLWQFDFMGFSIFQAWLQQALKIGKDNITVETVAATLRDLKARKVEMGLP